MKRMRLKKEKRTIKHKKLITFIVIFLLLIIIFFKITSNVYRYFLNYAEAELIKLTAVVINGSVSKDTFNKLNTEDLYFITKNNNNEIEMVDYNSNMVNEFLDNATNEIQHNLLKMQNGEIDLTNELKNDSGVLFEIPLGIITNNPIFNNFGPKIPVRMQIIGSLLTNINVKVQEYGINNVYVEMVVFIEVQERIVLPLVTKEITITNEIPVSYKLISGKIPDYYGAEGISKSSNIFSIPLE